MNSLYNVVQCYSVVQRCMAIPVPFQRHSQHDTPEVVICDTVTRLDRGWLACDACVTVQHCAVPHNLSGFYWCCPVCLSLSTLSTLSCLSTLSYLSNMSNLSYLYTMCLFVRIVILCDRLVKRGLCCGFVLLVQACKILYNDPLVCWCWFMGIAELLVYW